MKSFYHLVGNTVIASITNFTVWFAITFFVFLQTKSVFATSMISGIYLVSTAVSGFWFGSLIDSYKKKTVMLVSSLVSLFIYVCGLIMYLSAGSDAFNKVESWTLWIFVTLLMMGVIAGNLRNIALPTLVTLLVPEKKRDKANGLVGMANGVGFMVTSIISGFLVGLAGMYYVLVLAVGLTVVAIIHLLTVSVGEKKVIQTEEHSQKIDLRGTLKAIAAVPGLFALIFFTTFNNFLGGVFMSLMDAYGLSLVSVQVWGLIWGFLSIAFIIGGLVIAKFGLGKNPLRAMFIANLIIWSISSVFTIYPSIIPLMIGMFIYLCVIPFIQASEQTIIQKLVPPSRQGRIFGFAQSVEQAASPLTAFAIGPITQFIFIPFMTTGAGVGLIGGWFGTGPERGIALVFTIAGIIGLCVTLLSFSSKYYRMLSERYLAK
jgi:MFS transporter, DHA3 family, multidrug efflux protein